MQLPPWLQHWLESLSLEMEFYGNSLYRWLIAAGMLLVVAIALRLVKGIVARRIEAYAMRTAADWAQASAAVLRTTRSWFLLVLAFFLASLLLVLPPRTMQVVQAITVASLLIQAAVWGTVVVDLLIAAQIKRRLATDAATVTTMSAMGFVGKLILYVVVLLLILQNLGVDVTALVAGLGVGGIAVALAAQNILGDLFASLSIVLDKPFVLGDFIIVGDSMGTVQHIGLRTTRIRSLSGEQLVFPNNDLLKSRIRNFKRMEERRIVFTIDVTYQTPYEKLALIPAILRAAVEVQDDVRFDRAHFKEFGASSLVFEVVYFVLSGNFNKYMDTQQVINLILVQRFQDEGIEFAYPTRTIFLANSDGENKPTIESEMA